ncbi:MAG: hypothetical protein JSV20_05690 [Candidatus Bathyarchaeota archaeon]|nr:MAG: hypothetical protein JSV20_05690 [Candidatus Bathyarchaeota archaeon]
MDNNERMKGCACTQKLSDLARAARTVTKSSLKQVTCVNCGKVFWSNAETASCFDCTRKLGTQINPAKNG